MATLEVFTARHFVESFTPKGRDLHLVGSFYDWYAPKSLTKIEGVFISTGTIDAKLKKGYKDQNILCVENIPNDRLDEIKTEISAMRNQQGSTDICFRRNRLTLNDIAYVSRRYCA